MPYIRSDEDYYASLGMSEKESRVQVRLDREGVDYGVCNPRKAREAAEREAEIRREVKADG